MSIGLGPVHPRACGEHYGHEVVADTMAGSSPRLRGTSQELRRIEIGHRFIPAPAGNIGPLKTTWSLTAVHPRACGEHDAEEKEFVVTVGSSPRLRGTYRRGWGNAH